MRKEKTQLEIAKAFQKAAPYLSIVYTFFGSIIIFGYLGYWLDGKWNKSPLFLIIGVFLGFALGMYNMIRVITELERKDKE